MAPQWVVLTVMALLPAVSAQVVGDGLGGLAPVSSPDGVGGPSTANIDVPTDLCEREFCLQAAPAACGGNCILTPLANQSTFCATKCIGVWNSASVQTCLAGQATGVYIQEQLTAIADRCNAGAIAEARRREAAAKYNKLFPCTADVNATTLLALDTCPTGTNATAADGCPSQCSAALLDIPATCRDTFPTLSAPWNATLSVCITSSADGPATAAGSGIGSGGGVNFLGPAAAPGGATPSNQAAALQASLTAMSSAAVAAIVGAVILG